MRILIGGGVYDITQNSQDQTLVDDVGVVDGIGYHHHMGFDDPLWNVRGRPNVKMAY